MDIPIRPYKIEIQITAGDESEEHVGQCFWRNINSPTYNND
jgi:hypothetical protein